MARQALAGVAHPLEAYLVGGWWQHVITKKGAHRPAQNNTDGGPTRATSASTAHSVQHISKSLTTSFPYHVTKVARSANKLAAGNMRGAVLDHLGREVRGEGNGNLGENGEK